MSRVARKSSGGGLSQLSKIINEASKTTSKVGYIDGAKHLNGTPVATIAVVQEFGSVKKKIPPRSFFRSTINKRRGAWAALGKSGAKAMIIGKVTPVQVFEGLGLAAEGDIKKTISQITSPALAPGTVAARKAKLAKGKKVGNLTKPLIETGIMAKTLTSAVEQK